MELGRPQPFSRRLPYSNLFRVSLCSPGGLNLLCIPGWLTTVPFKFINNKINYTLILRQDYVAQADFTFVVILLHPHC